VGLDALGVCGEGFGWVVFFFLVRCFCLYTSSARRGALRF
jgi:hypothetical protein